MNPDWHGLGVRIRPGEGHSASRREGIVFVGVLLPDLSVDSVHQDFTLLVLGNLAGGLHCRFLRGMV